MRILPYVLYLLLLGSHEVIWRDVTGVFGATINVAGMMVLLVALYKAELTAARFGFFAGLVMAAGTPQLFGWHAFMLALLGVAAYHVRLRLNLDSLYSKILLVLGGIVVHNVICLLIGGGGAFWNRLFTTALTGAIYTTLVAWVFFLFKEGIVTVQKIKSIF